MEKEFQSFYDDLSTKTLYERVLKFYDEKFVKFQTDYKNETRLFKRICMILIFFHICVDNLEPVVLGIIPFSTKYINKKAFLKNFTRKEQYVVKKALVLMEKAERDVETAKTDRVKQPENIFGLLALLWQAIMDIMRIIAFISPAKGGLPQLVFAYKMCRTIRWQKEMSSK